MTAFSFVLGVHPAGVRDRRGAEMRVALGTAVFAGMIGVTLFGLVLTPVFYTTLRKFSGKPKAAGEAAESTPEIYGPVRPGRHVIDSPRRKPRLSTSIALAGPEAREQVTRLGSRLGAANRCSPRHRC